MLKILPSVPRGTKYKIKNILTLKAILEPALSALCDYSQIGFRNKSMRTVQLKKGGRLAYNSSQTTVNLWLAWQ